MSNLIGVRRDTHCADCEADTVEEVTHDEDTVVFARLDCCGREVEGLAVDFDEALADCGV